MKGDRNSVTIELESGCRARHIYPQLWVRTKGISLSSGGEVLAFRLWSTLYCCHFHRCCGNERRVYRDKQFDSTPLDKGEGRPGWFVLIRFNGYWGFGSIDPLLITLELLLASEGWSLKRPLLYFRVTSPLEKLAKLNNQRHFTTLPDADREAKANHLAK